MLTFRKRRADAPSNLEFSFKVESDICGRRSPYSDLALFFERADPKEDGENLESQIFVLFSFCNFLILFSLPVFSQKQISSAKQRPPKISKSSSIQEIEIEVAEVLYGLTRQFHDPSKTDAQAQDAKDANGSCNETKSRASSPSCSSPPRAASQSQSQSSLLPHGLLLELFFSFPFSPEFERDPMLIISAPKRKRPRPVKYEDESPTIAAANASISSASKTAEGERPKMDISSPKSEKTTSFPAENGGVLADSRTVDTKPEITAADLETSVHSKEPRRPDGNGVAASTTNT